MKFTISYAQNREDVIIDAFFPDVKNGTYIDVGANHPLYHSVTKLFYDKGWRGINFEPNPMLFKQIEQHRAGDKNLMLGLGDKEGSFDLRVYHSRDGLEGISTLSKDMQDDYKEHVSEDTKDFTDINIKVKTLADVLASSGLEHIHFMKVDVEGFEYEVLKGNDWKRFRPELICIESNHIMKDWRPILKQASYLLVFNDGLNDYYLAAESKHRAEFFDYAKIFLSSKPVVGFELAEQLRTIKENADAEINILKTQLAQKDSEIEKTKQLLSEITPLKQHIKRQVKIKARKLGGKKEA